MLVVLVTGGSGFIGSHIVDELKERGFDVRIFDKVRPLREDVEWFHGDLMNNSDLILACRDVDAIFHLAAIADVNIGLANPELCLSTNENGTLKLLTAASTKEVERVILASSTWVYGRAQGVVDESCPIPMPDHIYTKTKIGQEHLLFAWHKHYGLPFTVLRYDIPYGPRMRSNLVIAMFVRSAMKGEPITIYGDGMQGRCFIYIDDLAEGNVAALHNEGKDKIFNLAGSEFITINDIATNLKEEFNSIKVGYKPAKPSDFQGVVVSNEKASRLLGWRPRTPFREGLRKYIEYVRSDVKSRS